MTPADDESRSEYYRNVADSLRLLAQRARSYQTRQELIELADRFERMAEFSDKWHQFDH